MTDHFKRFANLQARCALAGIELRACRNDQERHSFILTHDHVTREMPSLDDVERWLSDLPEGTHAS